MRIPFATWDGAGNRFHFVESGHAPAACGPALARALCSGNGAPPADGLMILDGSRARFWNRDGSPAAFCGNGARCLAARLLALTGRPRVRIRIEEVEAEGWRVGEEIAVRVPEPNETARPDPSAFAPELGAWAPFVSTMALIQAGVPHLCVLFGERAPACRALAHRPESGRPAADLALVGAALRTHPRFAPEGVNVDFIRAEEPGSIRPEASEARACLETFERGLEALSPACGSGALAAACLLLAGRALGRVGLTVASGSVLRVEKKGPVWILQGPARPVARGEFVWSRPEC